MSELPFPTAKRDLATNKPLWPGPIDIRYIHERDEDLTETIRWIDDVWKRDRNALGFVPVAGWIKAVAADNVAVIRNNGEKVGYAVFHESHSGTRLTFAQVAIKDDARQMQHGRLLVAAIAARHPTATQRAVVKDQLPANEFWTSIGFTKVRTTIHATSHNRLNHYIREPIHNIPFMLGTKQ